MFPLEAKHTILMLNKFSACLISRVLFLATEKLMPVICDLCASSGIIRRGFKAESGDGCTGKISLKS